MVLDIGAFLLLDFLSGLNNGLLDKCKLFLVAYQRNHDLRNDVVAFFCIDFDRSFHDSSCLHLSDLRECDSQTAAAVTHHRVELMECVAASLDVCYRQPHLFGQCSDVFLGCRNELVKRRIQETNGNRSAFHSLVDALEVALLERNQLVQSRFSLFDGVGKDHLADLRNSVRIEEHVLSSCKSDTLSAHANCICSILRSIRVGSDFQSSELVCPVHDSLEVTGNGSFHCRDVAEIDLTGGAVKGDVIAFLDLVAAELDVLLFLVNLEVAAAGYTACAHTTSNNCCVGGHTTAHCQNAFCSVHAFDILRGCLLANKDNSAACSVCSNSIVCVEIDTACSSTGRSGKRLTDLVAVLESVRVKCGVQQLIKALCLDTKNCFLRSDHAFVYQIACNLDSSLSGSLAVSGLQEVKLAFLDGELHILHVAIVLLKSVSDLDELLVALRQILLQLCDRLRSTDTCNDVFALCVDQILTEDTLCARCGVTCERNACTGCVAHVTKYHGLHVDSGAPLVRDIIHHSVVVCSRVIPGTENSLDGFHQLYLGILRELFAHLLSIDLFVLGNNSLQILCLQLCIIYIAVCLLLCLKDAVEIGLAHAHNDIREHLDESSVGIICKSRIAGLCSKALDRDIIQTKVQDCIHHTGHGCSRAGTNGDKKRVLSIAKLLSLYSLKPLKRFKDLRLCVLVDCLAIIVVICAGLSRNCETVRDGKTDVGHLSQVRTFSTKEITHAGVTFVE